MMGGWSRCWWRSNTWHWLRILDTWDSFPDRRRGVLTISPIVSIPFSESNCQGVREPNCCAGSVIRSPWTVMACCRDGERPPRAASPSWHPWMSGGSSKGRLWLLDWGLGWSGWLKWQPAVFGRERGCHCPSRSGAIVLQAEFSERLRMRLIAIKPAEFSSPNRNTQLCERLPQVRH